MTTRRERMERRAQLRREWAESRERKAAEAFERGDLREEKSGIPFGQPILVGHHSERAHRNAIERAQNAMFRGCEHAAMAKRHESKADGIETALENSIFDDDPDATERLQAKVAKLEKERDAYKSVNAIIRRAPKYKETPDKLTALEALGMSTETARRVFVPDCMGNIGVPAYRLNNLGAEIRRCHQRILTVARVARERIAAEASATGASLTYTQSGYCRIVFAEYPGRAIINDLKAAGFWWSKPAWHGKPGQIPASVAPMLPQTETASA